MFWLKGKVNGGSHFVTFFSVRWENKNQRMPLVDANNTKLSLRHYFPASSGLNVLNGIVYYKSQVAATHRLSRIFIDIH